MANENTAQLGMRLQVIEWVSCVTAKSAGRRLRWVDFVAEVGDDRCVATGANFFK